MSSFDDVKVPLKAPWPPGQTWRMVDGGPLGELVQLRPGSVAPPDLHRVMMAKMLVRRFRYGAAPCPN